MPVGEEVRSIVEHYVATLPEATPPAVVDKARSDFTWFFLDGFTDPESAMGSSDTAAGAGSVAGRDYRRKHPDRLASVMTGFGYTAVKVQGTLQTGFEISSFSPDDQPRAMWWLSVLGDTPAAKKGVYPARCSKVRIAGFLSPPGSHGQMGMSTHQVYVYELSCVK